MWALSNCASFAVVRSALPKYSSASGSSMSDEINATPPSLPGDQRPITCQLAKPAQSI